MPPYQASPAESTTPVTQASYTNHLLIAMPALTGADFSHSVTLVCEQQQQGRPGIVLNKPSSMVLRDVLAQMQLEARDDAIGAQTVLCGGPVRTDRGFVCTVRRQIGTPLTRFPRSSR